MKKFTWLSLALLTSAAILIGCQKQIAESSSDPASRDKLNVQMKTAGATCESGGCIEVGEESGATATIANYNPAKNITVNISNDDDEVIFRFSSTDDIHYINIDGTVVYCSSDHGGNPINQATFEYRKSIGVFNTDWTGCEERTYAISIYRNNCTGNGAGNAVNFNASHKLVPVCTCDEELLTYETQDNLNIVFSYNDDEKLTNAKVEFTFPQVLNLPLNGDGKYVAPDGKIYSVNNPTNQTVFTWYGDLPCRTDDAITFAFSHTADCSAPPTNDGQAIIWTDFKVNEESKKGSNSNIVAVCPN